jgi:hypothetical protein
MCEVMEHALILDRPFLVRRYSTAACPVSPNGTLGLNCSVTDPITGDTFDFSSLGRSTDYVVAGDEGFE